RVSGIRIRIWCICVWESAPNDAAARSRRRPDDRRCAVADEGRIMIVVERLPSEIVRSRRCVVWRYVRRAGQPKPTKPPFQPKRPDRPADVTDPRTWGTFAEALAVVIAGRADGLGIVLGDGLLGVDLDHCRNVETRAITAEATDIILSVDSFAEVSPTRTGVHILAHGTLPTGRRRMDFVEMYDGNR